MFTILYDESTNIAVVVNIVVVLAKLTLCVQLNLKVSRKMCASEEKHSTSCDVIVIYFFWRGSRLTCIPLVLQLTNR